ncbi:MAG TPA: hypothetical protein VIK80_03575 [Flavihumibacter sp.]|jgi:hypothetical protein
MRKSIGSCLLIAGIAILASCGKETKEPDFLEPVEYMALEPGKTLIYQLDSIVKRDFDDVNFDTLSYQAKDVVDSEITDNLGRKSWRVYRYLRPLESTDESAWQPDMTYMITPLRTGVEVIEHNLRFQKLAFPVSLNTVWRGNSHINTTPGGPLDYLDAWQYSYTDIGGSFSPFDTPYDNTITILQADEALGVMDEKPESPDLDAYRTYAVEVYAKGIGLIYKELRYWVFSARTVDNNGTPTQPFPFGKTEGAGIRLRLISHN